MPDCWLIFFASRLMKWQADSLMGLTVCTTIGWIVGCQNSVFVYVFGSCLLCYWSCFSGRAAETTNESARGQTTVTSQTRDFPLCHELMRARQGVFRRTDDRHKLCGSIVFGIIAAAEKALTTSSFNAWCLIDQWSARGLANKCVHLSPAMTLMGLQSFSSNQAVAPYLASSLTRKPQVAANVVLYVFVCFCVPHYCFV